MLDDSSMKQHALDEVKKMLADHLAKRLGSLKDDDAAPADVDPGDKPGEDDVESPAVEDAEDAAEPEDDAAPADDGKPENPMISAAMKRLDQLLKPKKG